MERQICEVQLILRRMNPLDFFDLSYTGIPNDWTESLFNLRDSPVTMKINLEVNPDSDYAQEQVENLRKSLARMSDKEFAELQQRLPLLSHTLTLLRHC